MGATVRFLLGEAEREIVLADPTRTVLDYLRTEERRTGTKEGCAEGDCGACTVLLGEARDGAMRYRAVNACIAFAATLDGKQLLSVEDLAAADGTPHPVQRAMVAQHASQCGFCTPGFVMALAAFRLAGAAPTRAAIDDALAGNLCRCTGYRPIIDAARAACADPAPDPLRANEGTTLARLQALAPRTSLAIVRDGRRFLAPRSVAELAALCEEFPEAILLAGGTDVGLAVTKALRDPACVIALGAVGGLDAIVESAHAITIGATATYSDAAPVIARHYPDFGELIRRIGSVQVRNVATLGGNIANASPIGDTMPALLALDARLLLRRGSTVRELPLAGFYRGYRKTVLEPGEFLERIVLPKPVPGQMFRAYKLSKRFDQDISAVCAAFALTLEAGRVSGFRAGFGGLAATPARAPAIEAAVLGRRWDEATLAAAQEAFDASFTPLSDMRASSAYRRLAGRNLLRKLYLETAPSGSGRARTRILEPVL
ncbi:MAG: xanthine dehydrogenase small subunit [Acetobacteraceae bacterium]